MKVVVRSNVPRAKRARRRRRPFDAAVALAARRSGEGTPVGDNPESPMASFNSDTVPAAAIGRNPRIREQKNPLIRTPRGPQNTWQPNEGYPNNLVGIFG